MQQPIPTIPTDKETALLPSIPVSDAEVDFNAEPHGIPLSPTKLTVTESKDPSEVQQPQAEQKSEEEILDVKTCFDQRVSMGTDLYSSLYAFLNPLGIDRADLHSAGISESQAWKLFQKETGCWSFLQWCSLDHIFEKNLQWPLLSPKDVGGLAADSWCKRVRPHGRSILLKNVGGLMKAYATRGFTKGVETSVVEAVHYFIYAMLAYRLVTWMQIDQENFVEFKDLFQNSNQKGIDSLVTSLAELAAKWLKLILVSPVIVGVLQSLVSLSKVREMSSRQLQQITEAIADELKRPSGFCRSTVREMLPPFAQISALNSKIQNLEQLVRWDGRLSPENRRQSFECVRRAAKQAHQVAQLRAMESLAKLTHGVGFKDLPRLHAAGYSKADLLEIIYAKTMALSELENLTSPSGHSRKDNFRSAPRRIYATYLLWWLGLSTSFWKQRLPLSIFKAAKLLTEIYFLQKIVESILEAIHCPDKPGFKFGEGYLPWAADYTADCFTARVTYFRTLDANESVAALIAEIPQYHLTELTTLSLFDKSLTEEEAAQIVQAVVQQGAPLQTLDLSFNQISVLKVGFFNGLSQLTSLDLWSNQISFLSADMFNGLSQLTTLTLGFNQIIDLDEGVFSGLSQLTSLSLGGNQINDLNAGVFSGLSQLTDLSLFGNQISLLSEGMLSGLNQLKFLDLGANQISLLSVDVFNELSQLRSLNLWSNQISAFNAGVFDELSQLTGLSLGANRISLLSIGVLSRLEHLQTLDLSRNLLNTSTFVSILPSLPMTLTELDISLNQISTLPQNFSILLPVGLKSLSIGGNRFIPPVLTPEFMQYFPLQLTSLGLESSLIVNITDHSFSEFSMLTTLDLRYNQISVIGAGGFNGLNQLTFLYLDGNQISVLNAGVLSGLSQLTDLSLDGNQISDLSAGMFNGLSQLTFLYLGYNQISVFNEDMLNGSSQLTWLYLSGNQIVKLNRNVYGGLSQLTYLYLDSNQLNDAAIQNLTQNFPYQLKHLDVSDNQIGNDGALALANILPCTNLTFIGFTGNPANDTALAVAVQQKILKKICEDQRCHANLPATESCGVTTNSMTATRMTWEDSSSIEVMDEEEVDSPDAFYWSSVTELLSLQSTLALPSTTSESISSSLIPVAAGAVILGMAGLSILFFKNSTWMQAIVTTGNHFLQRCWSGGKTEEAKASFPAPSSPRRYTLFSQIFNATQRIFNCTVASDRTPR